MLPTDIEQLISLSAPAVDPRGEFAIVAAAHPSLHANRNVSQLWRVSLSNGSRERLTRGVADRAPQLTKDGEVVLFLRADQRSRAQVFAMRTFGGEPVQVTRASGGVESFAPSGDGSSIAYVASVPAPGRSGSVEGLESNAESPRYIETNQYLANGVGYTADARSHVFMVSMPDLDGEPDYERAAQPGDTGSRSDAPVDRGAQLTHGDFEHHGVAWSDAGKIFTVSARHAERDHDLLGCILELDPATPEAEPHAIVTAHAGLSIHGGIRAVGDGVVFLGAHMGESGRDFVARNAGLYVLDHAGAAPRLLTDAESVDLGEVGSMISLDGEDLLVQDRSRGRVQLLRVTLRGDVVSRTNDDVEVTGSGVGGGRVVVSVQTPTSYGELGIVEGEHVRVLTDFGARLQQTNLITPTEITVRASDGSDIHGWVWRPEGEGPHPVLLNIHGGPFAAYGVHVFDEAQVAVARGYAVVQCNPRGSAGYGQAHGRAIKERMGTVDMTDVLEFLEGAIDEVPGLDADRVGIMGGSYGGYLTAWTIAHDHRFAAAIVERGFLDPAAFIGTSDIGWFFSGEYTGADAERVAAQSPFAHVAKVQTPTLVVHSELDYRCPLEQAQRYYAALKAQGTETAMLVFPGEDHELTRSGQPRHRVERFEYVMRWWAKYLPTAQNHA